jgi:uncharacterized protein
MQYRTHPTRTLKYKPALFPYTLPPMLPRILMFLDVLCLFGLGLALLTILLMARMILRPPRMNDGKAMYLLHRLSPGDLGLRFETQNFSVRDAQTEKSMTIAGWWIPADPPTPRCAILLHGYADAKVGSIAWAPLLHDLGLNILAIDLRAHGESDGHYSTAGFWERHDLNQVIDQLRATRPAQTQKLILFGISLGAAVAAAAAERRFDLHAAIFDSPFADYRRAVAAHLRLLGLPTGWILQAALRVAEHLSKSEFDAVRPIDTISHIRCPVLIVLEDHDELLDADDITALRKTTPNVAVVPNASHLQAMEADPIGYAQRIRDFLDSIAP